MLAWSTCAFALNPNLDISQYAHTSWKIRDGFTKGEIHSIAQTPDGYLWLGTDYGLLRFDGMRAIPWKTSEDQQPLETPIRSLLVTRDGTLWIGSDKGLASWKGGKLTQYPELTGVYIFSLIEAHDGTVWVGSMGVPTGRLCSIHMGTVDCHGADGALGRGIETLYEDRNGNVWAGAENGLWRWSPGSPKFYPLPDEPNGIDTMGEDSDGTLLIGRSGGIHRFVDGKTVAYPLPGLARQFKARRIFRDRDGSLWIGTSDLGLLHLHEGRTDVYGSTDGLSADVALRGIFEDHEGDIWVPTTNGLDRFREFAVVTMTGKQGLSNDYVGSVLVDRDGSIWFSTRSGLDRLDHGQISTYRLGAGDHPASLFQDDRGRIWVSTLRSVSYLEGGKFVPLSDLPGGNVLAIVQGRLGNLWIANETQGALFRLTPQGNVEKIPWSRLGHKDHISVLAADPVQGVWIGFFLGGIASLAADGSIIRSYTVADGLGGGRVSGFFFDHEDTLWIATAGGLSRLRNGHLSTLTSKNGLPCDAVHWAIEEDDHSLWLYTACGVVRIQRSELDAWTAAVELDKDTKRTIKVTVLDMFDGVRSLPDAGHNNPQVAKTADGRIWFLPWDGVSVIDPHHLPFNKLPPPVHIEQVVADRQQYEVSANITEQLRLPARSRDLQIDYTALSLVAPEKIRFRYKLDGYDRDWQDAGNRRQAFYTNLRPGTYTFHVVACNNDGVWNETGAVMSMVIPPAFYQTYWFITLCVLALGVLIWLIYVARVRQLATIYKGRMEERVNERERIARDLHDTFLQSVQGLILKFDAAAKQIPCEEPARKAMESALDRADEVMAEGRDRVRNLRDATALLEDLPRAFTRVVDENSQARKVTFKTVVEGRSRELNPMVLEESYAIGREALINALTHSEGHNVEAEITYDRREFRLRIRDDGKGIAPDILKEGGRQDHFGLQGMRERAERIDAQLKLWSGADTGTEVELLVPATMAYRSNSGEQKRSLFRFQ
jgi:signal transduction histidine kinase/ligand-binding sensor domain-containing protein